MAVRLLLVRHARPAGNWDVEPDAALDGTGRAQAADLADALGGGTPWALVTSPLRRTRETAAPLAARWGVAPVVDPRVGEIPSPDPDPATRGAWLRTVLGATWDDMDGAVRQWRDALLGALTERHQNTVVVTHFVAINTVVGHATGDPNLIVFRPGHCSRTELELVDGRLRLVALGDEAVTEIR